MDLGCNSQLLVTGSCSFLITGIQKLGFRCLVSGVRSDDLRSCGKLHLTNAEVGMWPPARRGHRGLRPGGNVECGRMESLSHRGVGLMAYGPEAEA